MMCWACQLFPVGNVESRNWWETKRRIHSQTNRGPENRQSQKETIVFQSSIFRGELLNFGGVMFFFQHLWKDIRFWSILLAVLVSNYREADHPSIHRVKIDGTALGNINRSIHTNQIHGSCYSSAAFAVWKLWCWPWIWVNLLPFAKLT